jgi:hypothetical protein
MTDKLQGKITISRSSGNDGDYVLITIEDSASRTGIEVSMSIEEYGYAVTGLSMRPCKLEICGDVNNIGKVRQLMTVEAEMPSDAGYSNQQEIAAKICQEAAPDGWVASGYFGSRSSFFQRDGKRWCRTDAVRWVDASKVDGDQA